MGQQHDFYLVQSGNLVPRAALWRGFLACFQQPSLLRPANLDSSDIDHTNVTPFTATSLSAALQIAGFKQVEVSPFYQLPFLWRYPFLKPIAWTIASLPLPYRPYQTAPWPESCNKLIRFSKEVMLLGVGSKPES